MPGEMVPSLRVRRYQPAPQVVSRTILTMSGVPMRRASLKQGWRDWVTCMWTPRPSVPSPICQMSPMQVFSSEKWVMEKFSPKCTVGEIGLVEDFSPVVVVGDVVGEGDVVGAAVEAGVGGLVAFEGVKGDFDGTGDGGFW